MYMFNTTSINQVQAAAAPAAVPAAPPTAAAVPTPAPVIAAAWSPAIVLPAANPAPIFAAKKPPAIGPIGDRPTARKKRGTATTPIPVPIPAPMAVLLTQSVIFVAFMVAEAATIRNLLLCI
jgi:hypothetical protein